MEVGEQPGAAGDVGAADRCVLGFQVRSQFLHLVGGQLGGSAPNHADLEHSPYLEHLARFVDARPGDPGAAPGLEGDELVAAELVERLAHEGARDLEDVGDSLLGELGAGHQAALDDRRDDRIGDAPRRVARRHFGAAPAGTRRCGGANLLESGGG